MLLPFLLCFSLPLLFADSCLGTFLCLHRILVIQSWNRTPFVFFWIPNSVRKVLTNFEVFSQPDGSFGKPNQPVHWVLFAGTVV